jgi:hypothetical protein
MKKYVAACMLFFALIWVGEDLHAQGIEFIHEKKFQELLDMAKRFDRRGLFQFPFY